MLEYHPDDQFTKWVILSGFRIGFNHSAASLRRNMPSAYKHPMAMKEFIEKELTAGNLIGPLSTDQIDGFPADKLQFNRMEVVPKGHSSGKWRIIIDLSFPRGYSVNDEIRGDLCSLEYTTVDLVAGAAFALGMSALLAKVIVKSAYWLLAVHLED